MPNPPDWKPAAWLYGGGITLFLVLRLIFRGMLATPAGRLKFAACLVAMGIYGATVFALVFASEAPADIARHFGDAPGGIPVRIVIWLVVTLLYVPFVLGVRHVMLLTMAAQQMGYFGALGLLRFFFSSAQISELRRSRQVTALCAIYGVLLLVALGFLAAAWHDH